MGVHEGQYGRVWFGCCWCGWWGQREADGGTAFVTLCIVDERSMGGYIELSRSTIRPMIPTPAAVTFMLLKHDLMLFLTMTSNSIPTSCFEASYKRPLIKRQDLDTRDMLTFSYRAPFSPSPAKIAKHHASSLAVPVEYNKASADRSNS